MHEDVERILYSEEEIRAKVALTGKAISADYKGKDILLVGVLKGAVVFTADLMRALDNDVNCEIGFITARSYGKSAVSGGKVDMDDIKRQLGCEIKGRHIIIAEDILDSGLTLDTVKKGFLEQSPASLKICVLLDKRAARKADITPDYKCFDVENEFIVGYGLDYAERYRCLPYIGVLKKELYENEINTIK